MSAFRLTSPTNHASAESQIHLLVIMKRYQLMLSPRIDSSRGRWTPTGGPETRSGCDSWLMHLFA